MLDGENMKYVKIFIITAIPTAIVAWIAIITYFYHESHTPVPAGTLDLRFDYPGAISTPATIFTVSCSLIAGIIAVAIRIIIDKKRNKGV